MLNPRRAAALGAAAALLLASACASAETVSGPATTTDTTQPAVPASMAPSPSTPREPRTPPTPECTPAPLEQRAAAVLVVGMPHVTRADDPLAQHVVDAGVGGVFLSGQNVESTDQVRALVQGLRERADRPLLVSTDEESGRVAVMRPIVGAGPSPRRLAREQTPEEVQAYAAGIGAQLADVGVDLDLAPVLDLNDGPSDGTIGDRSFGVDPQVATDYGLAFALGLDQAGVVPTVKHFPGLGRPSADTHTESAAVDASLAELRATDLVPFQRAVDAGAPVVMLGHATYEALDPELPASVSPAAYDLLRDMGFDGVAITDSLGMGAVNLRWPFPEAAVRAIGAGADAALVTDGSQATGMRDALVQAVQEGRLPEERLDEAAARVTALAGGDPLQMSCTPVELPSF